MPKPATPRRPAASRFAVAACSFALVQGGELQLLPAGIFHGVDGRPEDAPYWLIDAALAQRLIDAVAARDNPLVIDYDHQTLLAKQNGQPAPAAGWFKQLEWREGEGLFATDVEWTKRASEMIAAGEYRFISPVILYDKTTGAVTALLMAAITNNPAIDGMAEAQLAAAAALHFDFSPTSLSQEIRMDELLEQLRWLLNLPVGATAEDILAQLQKLSETIRTGVPEAAAAASFDLTAHLVAQRTQIASLSAATPDPAKYVGIEVAQDLQTRLAQLSSELNAERLDGLIKKALDGNKLLPSQEAWARDWGAKDFAALSAYLDNAPPLAALSGTQTNGKPPKPQGDALTESEAALCRSMGISAEQYLATKQAESQA